MLLQGNAPTKSCDAQGFLKLLVTFRPRSKAELTIPTGRDVMIKIIIDALLFSCMGAFIAGIVVATAMLIS
jgi:hypothetical protein